MALISRGRETGRSAAAAAAARALLRTSIELAAQPACLHVTLQLTYVPTVRTRRAAIWKQEGRQEKEEKQQPEEQDEQEWKILEKTDRGMCQHIDIR